MVGKKNMLLQAWYDLVTGWMWPEGCSLETPKVDKHRKYNSGFLYLCILFTSEGLYWNQPCISKVYFNWESWNYHYHHSQMSFPNLKFATNPPTRAGEATLSLASPGGCWARILLHHSPPLSFVKGRRAFGSESRLLPPFRGGGENNVQRDIFI